jgi:AraC family transcriptional regulator
MVSEEYTTANVTDLPSLAPAIYVDRINRAVDVLVEHLAEPLRLEQVAAAAGFSAFHFHRLFRSLMGETLAAFIRRIRLERSLQLLSNRPGHRLTEVALACGFASSSDYSRSFRRHFGVAPRRFDREEHRRTRRAALKAMVNGSDSLPRLLRLPDGVNPDGFAARLRTQPPRHVAYIRVARPYESDHVPRAARRPLAWADARGFANGQWLGYQWDDPEIVALARCRYDVGVEVPAGTAINAAVGLATFPACTMAEVDIAGSIELELRALDWLYRTWLPHSGYAPANQPGFEAWNGRPYAHGMGHFELRVQLPVVPANEPL